MASPSPACQVKDGTGSYQSTTNGVNVTPGDTITIQLISSAAVSTWTVQCMTTDELSDAATVNAGLTIDTVTKTATFTAPVAGRAYRFQSIVNGGIGPDGTIQASYTTTFGIYTLTTGNRRVHAVDETYESNATFGWVGDFNDLMRNPFAANYAIVPTGTGLFKVSGGNQVTAGALLVDADVSSTASIAVSKFAPSGTKGQQLQTFDNGTGAVVQWGNHFLPTVANTSTGSLANQATTDSNGNQVDGIVFSGAAPTVSGFAGGYGGRLLALHTTGGPLVLQNNNSGSTAGNRILTQSGTDLTLSNNGATLLQYDGINNAWRVLIAPTGSIDASAIVSGTLVAARGGTGMSASTTNHALVGDNAGGWTTASLNGRGLARDLGWVRP